MARFYLPYNFIPCTGKVGEAKSIRLKYDFDGDEHSSTGLAAQARQDLLQSERFHGRIVCHLTLLTETVVGNEHVGEAPQTVRPYFWKGEPAISGNSLRGMIASVMETLSQSALRVLHPAYWPYFEHIDRDLPPWNPDRRDLTPAEVILGVAEDQSGQEADEGGKNLASRVRVFDAVLSAANVHAPLASNTIQLKELGLPKPLEVPLGHNDDVPSLYFHAPNDPTGSITKRTIPACMSATPASLVPKGRKVYLAHPPNTVDLNQMLGTNPKLSMMVQPLMRGTKFYFHIDFMNLDAAELCLLKAALVPGEGFNHRLGLGKALGLGMVEIKVAGLFLREPTVRYGLDALESAAYQHRSLVDESLCPEWQSMERYRLETSALADPRCQETDMPDNESLIDAATLALVLKAGGTSNLTSLQENMDIRWRRGHKKDNFGDSIEPPEALRPIRPDCLLPAFYEPDHENLVRKEPETDTLNQSNDEAVVWLRDSIENISERNYKGLEPDQIDATLAGPAMLRRWRGVNDTDLRERIRAQICGILKERNAKWRMSERVKRSYRCGSE